MRRNRKIFDWNWRRRRHQNAMFPANQQNRTMYNFKYVSSRSGPSADVVVAVAVAVVVVVGRRRQRRHEAADMLSEKFSVSFFVCCSRTKATTAFRWRPNICCAKLFYCLPLFVHIFWNIHSIQHTHMRNRKLCNARLASRRRHHIPPL